MVAVTYCYCGHRFCNQEKCKGIKGTWDSDNIVLPAADSWEKWQPHCMLRKSSKALLFLESQTHRYSSVKESWSCGCQSYSLSSFDFVKAQQDVAAMDKS